MAGFFTTLFGGSGGQGSGSAGRGKEGQTLFTFQYLQQLYEKLSKFRESDLVHGSDAVTETVRQITEALLWGEQNDARFFDFFCEKNILSDFVRVIGLQKTPKEVNLQLLQTLSMLVSNLKHQTSMYYLLSNNHINRLIQTPLDFEDEEILGYYIMFNKALAMRLDSEMVKFFFLQHPAPHFPLFVESTRFFNNCDGMVRTAVRTITLQVYRIDDPLVRRFVLQHAAESYFSLLAYHLRDLWLRLDVAAEGAKEVEHLPAIRRDHDLQQDLLIYLSDIFELGVPELSEVLADRLLNCAMFPVLLKGVLRERSPKAMSEDEADVRVVAPCVALFLIHQVFDILHVPCLLCPLAQALLQPVVPAALAFVLPEAPAPADPATPPPASLQEDMVPNWLTDRFAACLDSDDDHVFLLSAIVLNDCVRHLAGEAPGADDGAALAACRALLRGLPRRLFEGIDVPRACGQLLLDVAASPAVAGREAVRGHFEEAVRSVLLESADVLTSFAAGPAPDTHGRDWMFDVFAEEWALHQAPMPQLLHWCGEPERLLPPEAWLTLSRGSPASSSSSSALPPRPRVVALEDPDRRVRRAVRSLLWSRRLLRRGGRLRGGGAAAAEDLLLEESPVSVRPKVHAEEGGGFELGTSERIACGVVSASRSRCTRWLLLDDYWFMLMQPDTSNPGWGRIKLLCPLYQVESFVDRGEPRHLRVFLCNGPEVHGAQATLTFEDTSRCFAANEHVKKHRRRLREMLLDRLGAFVAGCAEEAAAAAPGLEGESPGSGPAEVPSLPAEGVEQESLDSESLGGAASSPEGSVSVLGEPEAAAEGSPESPGPAVLT